MGITMRAFDQMRAERDAARQEADQNAALVGELRGALLKASKDLHCGVDCKCERRVHFSASLSLTPPAALERVQREAAAKALEEAADLDWWSYTYTNQGTPDMLRRRAAELREASHG